VRYQPEQLNRLIVAVERQAEAIEGHTEAIDRLVHAISAYQKPGLGGPAETLYTRTHNDPDLVDEKKMAGLLNIPHRTLAKYRREGRFPNCWTRNARRIMWKVGETQKAWDRGIA